MALLNAITKNFNGKFSEELTHDEILRIVLNDYIKQNMTKEDKEDILKDVLEDLKLFRTNNQKEIEELTLNNIQKDWGMKI